MQPRRIRILASGLALACLGGGDASAGQVVTITTNVKGGWGQVVSLPITFNGVLADQYVGAFSTTIEGGRAVDTFCIDYFDETYPGSTWQASLAPIGEFKGNPAGSPMGSNGGAIGALYSRFVGDDADRIAAAALQVAIWKVEYDGTTSLSTGHFRFADSADLGSDQHRVYARVMADLQGFDPATATGPATLMAATSHPNGLYQDLVGPADLPVANVLATPEPGTLAMALSALAALGVARLVASRRRASRG